MGFFSDGERADLRIERMIMHVVGEPTFTAAREFPRVEQEAYFLDRLLAMDSAAVFQFLEGSVTQATLEQMAVENTPFQTGARHLSRQFGLSHPGQSKDGAFFIFQLAVADPATRLYAMLKYDYKTVLAKSRTSSTKQLRKIVDAFVQDASALQKSCLVRVTDGLAASEVSAKDRMGKSPDLTDYFRSFLDVERARTDQELNKTAASVLVDVLSKRKLDLPGQDIGGALRVAYDVLRNSTSVNADSIAHAVVVAAQAPVDSDLMQSLRKEIFRAVKHYRLDGLDFPPDAVVLQGAARKIVTTREKVLLKYPEALEGTVVTRETRSDGSAVITIKTREITGDRVVADRAS